MSNVALTVSRGTDGKWHRPKKLDRFNLTLTYDKGALRTYINGLLDQTIDLGKIKWGSVEITSPDHKLSDVSVYNRRLNWREISILQE
ncbi:LamG domain-containing protein [Sphingobacterium pedocola]|uniref:3-keto-disaccharide hydrolase domain-containing protein n=1 Tax=Sphingobacterium pedocola TaxID=2082722 RepID=A0ABR9T838_9SPHI|nr:hypothetical protein [Sphingobacterium pedocola]MBE8721514.1 hypothetical protein [Sphingobacterium pedocola]